MSVITVANDGAQIVATNYWESELAEAGKLYVSVNAGAIRVLLPPAHYGLLGEMRSATEVVLSRGPWPAEHRPDAIELLWDDGSDSPFALHLTPESFDVLPAAPPFDRDWIASVWIKSGGRPLKSLERLCHWREVDAIPYLKPWRKQ